MCISGDVMIHHNTQLMEPIKHYVWQQQQQRQNKIWLNVIPNIIFFSKVISEIYMLISMCMYTYIFVLLTTACIWVCNHNTNITLLDLVQSDDCYQDFSSLHYILCYDNSINLQVELRSWNKDKNMDNRECQRVDRLFWYQTGFYIINATWRCYERPRLCKISFGWGLYYCDQKCPSVLEHCTNAGTCFTSWIY